LNNVQVTILKNVIYQNNTLIPGEPGKPTNIEVPKAVAEGWIGRGLAKYRNPEDEVTKEDLIELTKAQATKLAEAEQAAATAKRTTAQVQGKLAKATEQVSILGKALDKAAAKIKAFEAALAKAKVPAPAAK